jgi:hypothetical protein
LRLDRSQAKAAAEAQIADNRKVADSATDAARKQTQANREVATATQSAERAKQDAAAKTAKQFVDSAGRMREENGRFVAGLKDASQASAGLAGTFAGFGAGIVSINAIGSATRSVIGVMHEANREAQTQVDKLLATKNLIREIAAIQGVKEGSSDAQVQKFLDIRSSSGLNEQAASQFMLEFAGSGEAKKGVTISPEEYAKAQPLLARFAAANSGGDAGAAGTYGRMAGLLMGSGKDMTADQLLAQQERFNQILSMGVGDNPTLIREAASKAAAFMDANGPGISGKPMDLAALVSVASMVNPKSADTMLTQVGRVTRGFTAKHSPLLEAAGITADDDMIGGLNKLFAQIDQAARPGSSPTCSSHSRGSSRSRTATRSRRSTPTATTWPSSRRPDRCRSTRHRRGGTSTPVSGPTTPCRPTWARPGSTRRRHRTRCSWPTSSRSSWRPSVGSPGVARARTRPPQRGRTGGGACSPRPSWDRSSRASATRSWAGDFGWSRRCTTF